MHAPLLPGRATSAGASLRLAPARPRTPVSAPPHLSAPQLFCAAPLAFASSCPFIRTRRHLGATCTLRRRTTRRAPSAPRCSCSARAATAPRRVVRPLMPRAPADVRLAGVSPAPSAPTRPPTLPGGAHDTRRLRLGQLELAAAARGARGAAAQRATAATAVATAAALADARAGWVRVSRCCGRATAHAAVRLGPSVPALCMSGFRLCCQNW